MIKTLVKTALAGALLTLGACATESGLSEEPGFLAGYGDGCATAHEEDKSFSTKRVRDADLFETDRAYRAGWRQGWQQCQTRDLLDNDGGRVLGNEPTF